MFIKNLILKYDLTSAPASLRIKQETAYSSICGGLTSICALVVFVVIFFIAAINLVQLNNITADIVLASDFDPTSSVQDFYFMIGLSGIEAYQLKSIIQFSLVQMTVDQNHSPFYNPIYRPVQLSRCNSSYLQTLGVTGIQFFISQNNLSNFYCPPFGTPQMILSGSWLIADAQILSLNVNKCVNSTANGFGCEDPDFIDQFISNITAKSDYILFSLLLIDTTFTPTQPQPIIKSIKSDTFMTFGLQFGTRGTVEILPYVIQTDQSFLPWTDISTMKGYYLNDPHVSTVLINNGLFLNILIYKSLTIQNISRQLGKIDDLLSYIGGLFALIFVVVQFIVAPYNEFKYQLLVAQNSMEYQTFQECTQQKMTFLTYVKIKIYLLLSDFNIRFQKTQSYSQLQKIRQEATYLLDPRVFLRRMNNLQNKIKLNFKQDEQMCLDVMGLPYYKQVKTKRKINLISDVCSISKIKDKIIHLNQSANLTTLPFMAANNQIHPQNQSQLQVDELSSSDQENNLIIKQIQQAMKKLRQKKYSSKFRTFYRSLKKKKRSYLQNKQIQHLFGDQEMYNAKVTHVLSNIEQKVCDICKELGPDLLGACSHFFHFKCFQDKYNENLTDRVQKRQSGSELLLFSHQETREANGSSQSQIICPICDQQINPSLCVCQLCKQNWQQTILKRNIKRSSNQRIIMVKPHSICRSCNFKNKNN